MTRDETIKVLMMLTAAYPNFKPANLEVSVNLWQKAFEENTFPEVEKAVMLYIKTDNSGFAPSVGQVANKITYVEDMTIDNEWEAWAKVRKAIRDSGRDPEKVFASLPEPCRIAIGNVANLIEMGHMKSEQVETVEQSHFMRAYKVAVDRLHEKRIIPKAVAEQIEQKREKLIPLLVDREKEGKSEEEVSQMTTEMNEIVKKFLRDNFGIEPSEDAE